MSSKKFAFPDTEVYTGYSSVLTLIIETHMLLKTDIVCLRWQPIRSQYLLLLLNQEEFHIGFHSWEWPQFP